MSYTYKESPPARVAWIETQISNGRPAPLRVATREGGVDRNWRCLNKNELPPVATREGGVDRNIAVFSLGSVTAVATREGGVDRNFARLPRYVHAV